MLLCQRKKWEKKNKERKIEDAFMRLFILRSNKWIRIVRLVGHHNYVRTSLYISVFYLLYIV